MSESSDIMVGKQGIYELLKRSPERIETLFIQEHLSQEKNTLIRLCRKHGVKFQLVPRKKLDGLTKVKHQGYIAQVFPPGFQDPRELLDRFSQVSLPLLVCCDQVQDQGNLGTLIRSLYAFDTAGLILTKDRSAHLGDRASKTSAGTLNHLPISRVTNLARFLRTCQDKDYWIYYAGLDSSCHNLFETPVSWPAILILGNEHRGVRPGVAKECTLGLKIPMLQSFDSLNVAQAGVIFIAEFLRKRLYT